MSPVPLQTRFDRYRFVTPEPLNVAPELVGAPLASVQRRAAAIAVDLLLIALLTGVSGAWLLGGLATVALQLRSRGLVRPMGRWTWVGWGGAALVLLLAFDEGRSQWNAWRQPHEATVATAAAASTVDDGVSTDTLSKLRSAATAEPADAAPSAASAAVPALSASSALAIAKLRVAALEAELVEVRRPRAWREVLSGWLDDAGAGLGWGIVYFSLLPAWWGGQTVGKKLFGLRVVELTGQPMTVMRCLKRYGGYAAGMATGGLGFAQVLWDPNRQGLHDKAAHTAVIDLRTARRDVHRGGSASPP